MSANEINSMRLDKWLWCARFHKTRSLAVEAINSGKVRMDDRKVKPSYLTHVGDCLTVRRGQFIWEVKILGLVKGRKSVKDAELLYKESTQSREKREFLVSQLKLENEMYPRTIGRPTKRQRRDIQKFTRGPK